MLGNAILHLVFRDDVWTRIAHTRWLGFFCNDFTKKLWESSASDSGSKIMIWILLCTPFKNNQYKRKCSLLTRCMSNLGTQAVNMPADAWHELGAPAWRNFTHLMPSRRWHKEFPSKRLPSEYHAFASVCALTWVQKEKVSCNLKAVGVSISQPDARRSDDWRRQGSSHRLEFKNKLRYSLSKYTSRGWVCGGIYFSLFSVQFLKKKKQKKKAPNQEPALGTGWFA